MADNEIPRNLPEQAGPLPAEPVLNLLLRDEILDEPLYKRLSRGLDEFFFPKKLPPLVLTSKPVAVKDIWGFYNGDFSKDASNNNSFNLATKISALDNIQLKGLCFLRDVAAPSLLIAKAGYAKNGLLKQVTYPTGGAMFFEYAQNVALLQGQTTNVGGVHVSKTSVTDAGYSNDCSHKIETNYSYNLTGSTQSSLWGVTMPVNSLAVSSYYSPQSKHLHYKLIILISLIFFIETTQIFQFNSLNSISVLLSIKHLEISFESCLLLIFIGFLSWLDIMFRFIK